MKQKTFFFIAGTALLMIVAIAIVLLYSGKQTGISIQPELKQVGAILPKDTAAAEYKLELILKVRTTDGDSTGGQIEVTCDGEPFQTIASTGTHDSINLDLDATYLMKCSKEGYQPKVIYFDTNVPPARKEEEFAYFIVEVELHKKTKKDIADPLKPVGTIKYDPVSGDFDKVKDK